MSVQPHISQKTDDIAEVQMAVQGLLQLRDNYPQETHRVSLEQAAIKSLENRIQQ